MVAAAADAMMTPKRIERPRPTKIAKPTGTVRVASVLLMMRGQKKSFQLRTKVKMATVAMTGLLSGMKMRQSRPKRLQPSNRPGFLQFDREWSGRIASSGRRRRHWPPPARRC